MFSSVNKMTGEFFEQLFWVVEYCVGVRFTQLYGMAIFAREHFTR